MSLIKKISAFFKKNKQNTDIETGGNLEIGKYIGKFVNQSGNDIGESIAVDKNRFIIKSSNDYLSIPVEKIILNTQKIIVGSFDQEEALKLGKEWFERKDTMKFDRSGMLIK